MTECRDPIPRRVPATDLVARLRRFTDARVGLGQAGAGLPTRTVLRFSHDHARARDAIASGLDVETLSDGLRDGNWPLLADSAVRSREEYLTRPDLGRTPSEATIERLTLSGQTCDLCVVVADGLSALAVNQNAIPVISALRQRLSGFQVGTVLLRNGRVAAGDRIALALRARAVLMLIGERPGLSAADSLGAYLTWKPRTDTRDAERYCVSNIRTGGMAATAAAELIVTLLARSLTTGRSGIASIGAEPALD